MFQRLWHWLGWGCGMTILPGLEVRIDCPLCMKKYVKPEVLAQGCAVCGHRLDRHTACPEGACHDCDCVGWTRPAEERITLAPTEERRP